MPKLVYLKSRAITVESVLAPPMAIVVVGGKRIDQPICQTPDDGSGIPVWSAVVDDETHTAIAAEPEFLGAGLNEVAIKDPAVFELITAQEVDDGKGGKKIIGMGEAPAVGEIVLSTNPAHTFGGWDPMTGDPA